ncbi:MAG: response regulator, partial [Planctomycetota bacterium]
RTPMTAILGYTDLILEKVSDPETVSNLKTIKRNGVFLLDIINDILDLSKIEAGKLEVQRESFEPVRLIHDVVSIMNVRAIEKGLQLSFDIDSRVPRTIQSDPKRLKQILVNLVGNAIKFTERGYVRIQAQCDRSNEQGEQRLFAVSVSDTGLGLAIDEKERLFEPFVQGDSGTTRDFGGTGLGLAISQRLASMLGGRVECQSEQGVGSTFTCFVQIGQSNNDTPSDKGPFSEEERIGTDEPLVQLNATVLIVDDRRDIRFLTSRLLTRVGATVEEASDGIEAMEKVQSGVSTGKTFDLIVLDMQMPRLDGYQVAKRLRQSGFEKPIIALTAEAMDGDAQRCLDCGCDAYASKPIDAARFVRLVHKYLGTTR